MAWQHRIGWKSHGLIFQSLHFDLHLPELLSQGLSIVSGLL